MAEPQSLKSRKSRKNPRSTQREDAINGILIGEKKIIAPLTIAVLAAILLHDVLLMNRTYMFKDIGSDTINGIYPAVYHIIESLNKGQVSWSFQHGMGGNILPLSGLGDPFSWLMLIAGKTGFLYAQGYVEFFKIIFGGIVFFLYARLLSNSFFVSWVASICFAFSAYMIVGGTWMLFSAEAVHAAILLYAFERLYKKSSVWLLPIATALIMLFQPVYLYVYGFFLLIYATLRIVGDNGWQPRIYGKWLLQCLGLATVGIAMGAVMGTSIIYQILNGPRVGGEASYAGKLSSSPILGIADATHIVTAIARFFSSELLGTGSSFKGWYNYLEAPMFYCGILSLVTAPQAFVFANKRKRMLYSGIIAFCTVPIIFPYFRYAFWLFSGDYYRAFSFIVGLFLLYLMLDALKSIERTGRVNMGVLIATVGILFTLLITLSVGSIAGGVNNVLRVGIMLILIVYALLLTLMSNRKARPFAQIGVVLAVCIEVVLMSYPAVNARPVMTAQELKQKVGYNDYTIEAANFVNNNDKTFFRCDKDYSSGLSVHASINDAKIQGYYSTPCYHNFNQPNYIRFLGKMGVIDSKNEYQTRWAPGVVSRPLLQTICNVKYVFSKGTQNLSYWRSVGFDSLQTFNDVTVLKNKYALPFGICYDSVMKESLFSRLSTFQRDKMLLRACIIQDSKSSAFTDEMKHFTVSDTSNGLQPEEYAQYVQALRQDTLTLTSFQQNHIEGTITLRKKKILYLSIPFDKGWQATINGKTTSLQLVNLGFTGIPLEAGDHTLVLTFSPPFFKEGVFISGVGLVVYVVVIVVAHRKHKKSLRPND